MPASIGYWKIRGLAQPLRFLLEYTGEDYTEKFYEFGPAPDYDRKQWLDDKYNLGMDFPNLPYYINGNVKISQSNAIMRYLGRKHNLIADKTDHDIRLTDMLENEAYDTRVQVAMMCHGPHFEDQKDEFITKTAPDKFNELSKILKNNNWFLGDKITYIDFVMYESLATIREITPATFDDFKNLKQFMARFEALEPIKKYMKSDRYLARPYHSPMAYYLSK